MKLSVIVLTYNHIHFIHQALSSVLTQKTDFEFEILIVEDCSTDGTRDVVIEFARKYPKKIHLLLSPVNMCSNIILINAIEAARGECIALLDGDDYWTSPYKLQKQLNFMENHPELTLSWHECVDVDRHGSPIRHSESAPVLRTRLDIRTMLQHPIRAVPMSVMFKRNAALPIPSWYRQCIIGDHPLWVLCLRSGLAGYLDETLGEYRVHSGGAMNGLDFISRHDLLIKTYQCYLQHLDRDYRPIVARRLARLWRGMVAMQRQAGNSKEARNAARLGLKDCPGDIGLLMLSYAPWIWIPLRACVSFFLRPNAR